MADEMTLYPQESTKKGAMKGWKDWSLPTKVIVGSGAVIVLSLFALAVWPKKAAASQGASPAPPPPAPPPEGGLHPNYTNPKSITVHLNQLPMLRPLMGNTKGSTYWVLGDELAPPVGAYIAAGAAATGNDGSVDAGSSSTMFLPDFAAQVANHGMDGLTPADVWFVVLGPKQEKRAVGALKESIAHLRKALPQQRILWVLARSAPGEIAQALNEAGEEWVRSANDDARAAQEAFAAATAESMDDINTAFPAQA